MTKIVLLTSQFAPFQLEVAEAVEKKYAVSYKVIFDESRNKRPPHWLRIRPELERYGTRAPTEDSSAWVDQVLQKEAPDVLLVGGIRGRRPTAAYSYRHRHAPGIAIGLWLEPPNEQHNPFVRFARSVDYAIRLRRADFVFAIGPNTKTLYGRHQRNTFLVPYGEDLSICLSQPGAGATRERLVFLFSGGLERRHNFPMILNALQRLLISHGPSFEFVISGRGPEQGYLDSVLAENPTLSALVRYDRDFQVWADRLRPFTGADVFVYPTNYAGWGLVIPEAMAAGQVVITTKDAEAANYFIEPEKSGLIIQQNEDELYEAFVRCVEQREWVKETGLAARKSAQRGDAPYVAGQIVQALQQMGLLA